MITNQPFLWSLRDCRVDGFSPDATSTAECQIEVKLVVTGNHAAPGTL
ncbi:hypothetical protein [Accumulibacter sp.]|nr:hypothetical protein [Accumulibacter sp.]MCM8627598.1 hypothetical protein [Accumulibacter sp.]